MYRSVVQTLYSTLPRPPNCNRHLVNRSNVGLIVAGWFGTRLARGKVKSVEHALSWSLASNQLPLYLYSKMILEGNIHFGQPHISPDGQTLWLLPKLQVVFSGDLQVNKRHYTTHYHFPCIVHADVFVWRSWTNINHTKSSAWTIPGKTLDQRAITLQWSYLTLNVLAEIMRYQETTQHSKFVMIFVLSHFTGKFVNDVMRAMRGEYFHQQKSTYSRL